MSIINLIDCVFEQTKFETILTNEIKLLIFYYLMTRIIMFKFKENYEHVLWSILHTVTFIK